MITAWEYKQEYNLFHDWMEKYVELEFDDYRFDRIQEIPNGIDGSVYRVVLKDDDNRSYSLYWPMLK